MKNYLLLFALIFSNTLRLSASDIKNEKKIFFEAARIMYTEMSIQAGQGELTRNNVSEIYDECHELSSLPESKYENITDGICALAHFFKALSKEIHQENSAYLLDKLNHDHSSIIVCLTAITQSTETNINQVKFIYNFLDSLSNSDIQNLQKIYGLINDTPNMIKPEDSPERFLAFRVFSDLQPNMPGTLTPVIHNMLHQSLISENDLGHSFWRDFFLQKNALGAAYFENFLVYRDAAFTPPDVMYPFLEKGNSQMRKCECAFPLLSISFDQEKFNNFLKRIFTINEITKELQSELDFFSNMRSEDIGFEKQHHQAEIPTPNLNSNYSKRISSLEKQDESIALRSLNFLSKNKTFCVSEIDEYSRGKFFKILNLIDIYLRILGEYP